MPNPTGPDERMEQTLGNLLRIGVVVSAAVVLVGGTMFLIHHGWERADYRNFGQGAPLETRSISGIWSETLALHARGVIQLGLLLLIATPVLRVAFSVLGFARQRDWLYVLLTLIVLGLLLYSFFGGHT
jgi:uncharacterized membrane protein